MTKKKVLATPRTSILPFNPEAEDLADDVVQMTEMVMSPAPAVQTPLERKSIGGNRRRSSLGFSAKTPLSEAEQIRIGNMYKLVLQLANENVSIIPLLPSMEVEISCFLRKSMIKTHGIMT